MGLFSITFPDVASSSATTQACGARRAERAFLDRATTEAGASGAYAINLKGIAS